MLDNKSNNTEMEIIPFFKVTQKYLSIYLSILVNLYLLQWMFTSVGLPQCTLANPPSYLPICFVEVYHYVGEKVHINANM